MKLASVAAAFSRFVKNSGEVKFALIQVTTRCNARCVDRCRIWALKPFDMKLEDVKFVIDVLAKNNFSILYFTGGETALYPHLAEAVKYAKKKGMITSITTNGTITKTDLAKLRESLDVLSVSVDYYDESIWDNVKSVPGISKKAKETIWAAKAYGIKLYGITFLNPAWTASDVEKIVQYVNKELGISFALSYPYTSSNDGTFVVDGDLDGSQFQTQRNLRNMVAKILLMKQRGFDVATASCYLRDVLRAHDGLPMKYPCKAGKTIITIDCNLNVFACYKREKLFNLKERQDLNSIVADNSKCDNINCLINCFKEASLASKETFLSVVKEELASNPKFYLKTIG
jgi:MoaA/NifB/PqqE/SkfB family radical SAM enzyme